ncbi:MAG TPA: DUF447 domain-containing protein [Pirellulales bacterium]|jgi:hypothetical protein|nr:DUF447 domain-containing protein [Pirellulales bacterium]
MILEGIVTTLNANGSANIAPMGPRVDESFDRLLLRPYQTSTTYANLKRTGEGVFHVTDDVLLLAQAAIDRLDPLPEVRPAAAVVGVILVDACRWYAFRIRSIDDGHARTEIVADVVDRGGERDFFGFNRAKHAVVEAAILATRIGLIPRAEIEAELTGLAVLVEKTGGPREHEAFELLASYVRTVRQDANNE